jgi:hypothetical protein
MAQHLRQAGDAAQHQQRVGDGAEGDDGADVLAPQALAQHEGVLRADGDDEREAEHEAGGEAAECHDRDADAPREGRGLDFLPAPKPNSRRCPCSPTDA